MKLRTKLFLFFSILTILVVGVIVIYEQLFFKKSFQEIALDHAHTEVRGNKAIYIGFTEGAKVGTLNWSSDRYVRELSKTILDTSIPSHKRVALGTEFSRYFREEKMRNDPRVIIVDLLDRGGIVVASTREDRLGLDERKEELEHTAHYFSKTITSTFGEVFLRGAVFESDEDSRPMFHATVRMFDIKNKPDGSATPLDGVLLVHFVPLTQLLDLFTIPSGEIHSDEKASNQEISIFSKEGSVVASTRKEGVSSVEVFEKNLVQLCFEAGQESAEEYRKINGISVVAASACLKDDGLVIISEVPTEEAYAALNALLLSTTYIVVGALLFVIVILFLSSRFLFSRINTLLALAKRVAQGDFSARFSNLHEDEFGIVGKAFNSILDTFSALQGELKTANTQLKKQLVSIEHDIAEHEDQKRFAEQSRRATLNLLQDTWKTKEKLESESRRLETIIGSMASSILLIDREYHIQLLNPKTERYFGIPARELLGTDLRTILTIMFSNGKTVPVSEWPIEKMFITGMNVTTTLDDRFSIITSKRTVPLPVIITVVPFKGGDSVDGVQGAVLVIRDATEELALDDIKSGFISVASHQLRTPLTTIRWYSEMLLEEAADKLSKSQQDFLKEINDGAKRLYQTIDLLLSISRVENGKTKGERQPIDLNTFTYEVMKELEPQIAQKELVVNSVPCAQNVGIVWLDPLVLRQVVLNLFSNAIRYTPKGGSIEACWEMGENPKQIIYSIKDTGIGIPIDQQSRIFTKFFRADNAINLVPDGTGLGLPLVKELVEAWGGEITFVSKEGIGSTFKFSIPLTTETQGVVEKNDRATIIKKKRKPQNNA